MDVDQSYDERFVAALNALLGGELQLLQELLAANPYLAEQEEFFREAEIDIRNNMAYLEIVQTTQQRTIAMLKMMLKSLGYEEIYIQFKNDDLIIDKVPRNDASS